MEQNRQCRAPDREGRENQGKRELYLGERWGSEREHKEGRVDSGAKEDRFQEREGRQTRRAFLEEVEGSISGCVDAKALREDPQSLGFTPSLAKLEMGKEVGRRRGRS